MTTVDREGMVIVVPELAKASRGVQQPAAGLNSASAKNEPDISELRPILKAQKVVQQASAKVICICSRCRRARLIQARSFQYV
jgi:hypothetical protein